MSATKLGPRQAAIAAEFASITRGVPLRVLKAALAAWLGVGLGEATKTALAQRYAKGRLSHGGSLESQRFRRLTPEVLTGLVVGLRSSAQG